jgi:transmembrane sensor
MSEEKAIELLNKYENGTISADEKALLETWYLRQAKNSTDQLSPEQLDGSIEFLKGQLPLKLGKERSIWPRIAAAAAILMFVSIGLYQYLHNNKKPKTEYANDIAPGSGKPYLTLANGQKVVLGNNNGVLAKQGSVTIHQDTAGRVSYTANNAQINDAPYNTLTNPRGGKVVSLVLPDGTLVKLEAASSITYQTAFTGKSRNVSTTGKVYFAVHYNKNQPFYATTGGQVTEDLGTHFIIDASSDEMAIKTTLIEGSVSVNKDGHRILLKPGQQTLATTTLKAQQADLGQETAWINGDFDFSDQDLHSIMQELARVYDIDVSYKGNVENIVPNGMISRSHNISAVLEMFEATNNIHFEINGRRVMVIAGQR